MILKSGFMKLSTFIVFLVFLSVLPKPSFCQPSDMTDRLLYHLGKASEHLEALYRTRSMRYPSYYSCEEIYVDRNSISDFQDNILGNNRGFLFYFQESNLLHIYLVTQTNFYYDTVHIDSQDLLKLEKRFRNVLQIEYLARDRRPQQRGAKPIYFEASNENIDSVTLEVSKVLFPAEIRKGLDGLRNIIIQPSGNIGLFPIPALKPFENAPEEYLIDSMSYSISPNVCFLFGLNELGASKAEIAQYANHWNRKHQFESQKPLLIGNPIYYQGEYYFPDLPGAENEVKTIHQKIGGRMLLGADANLANVKSFSRESDFLYFATHGITSLVNSLDSSYLTFTPDDASPNGYWTAREIQNDSLGAVLAVLSACQTGNGQALDAGFIGLGRAFFKAGVYNSIVSLWNVDDATTESLMVRFIEELQKPDYFFPSEHLRQAMLHQKSLTPEPRYWAPFMVFGIGY